MHHYDIHYDDDDDLDYYNAGGVITQKATGNSVNLFSFTLALRLNL